MLRSCLLAAGLVLSLAVPPAAGQSMSSRQPAGSTTVVVVRHAEKAADDPRDPTLSPAGQTRAQALAAALEDAGVTALYSTQFRRTRATAEPLAQRVGVPVTERAVESASMTSYARELAQEVLGKHRGETVLIVGHSNTVPAVVSALTGRSVVPLREEDYDRMFVVVIPPTGPARLLKATYGATAEAGRPLP